MSIKEVLSVTLFAVCLSLVSIPSHAASIYLVPDATTVDIADGTTSLDLFMDFAPGESTVGGGIDITVGGAVSFVSFTSAPYLDGLNVSPGDDTDFTGFGVADADNDFEIHFGSFAGTFGQNKLGTLTLSLDAVGMGTVSMVINSKWGEFFSAIDFNPQNVDLIGATIDVTQVPVPAAAWLFVSGLVGGFGLLRLRARS
ncbi:MAG TPA: hypothetical protein ENJ64_02690 [Thiotrichales bacterium]|nr:hypothetical protein [Thiotrichales bacterium]